MSNTRATASVDLSLENVLLRLFRCMDDAEKRDFIKSALMILSKRCSFDPSYELSEPGAMQNELTDDLDERLMYAWPGGWPGQEIVELDNVGDPGAWLGEVISEPISEVLFGWAWNDESRAASMAESYLHEIRDQDYPLPPDYGTNPNYLGWTDEDEEQVKAEFVAFLRHWRERVLQALEKQNPYEEQE